MPRLGWRKPESGERLSDHISIGVLARMYPPATVDGILAETGRREQRHRLLPAHIMVYYVMAMALFSHDAYEEVMRHLVEGLTGLTGWKTQWEVPTKAAIFKGRARLGAEPLRALFRSVVRPLGTSASRGVWYRRCWRVMSIDGTTLDIADTLENESFFGLWREAQQTGAARLWRVKKDLILLVVQELPDGSYLSRLHTTTHDRQHDRNGVVVLVDSRVCARRSGAPSGRGCLPSHHHHPRS